MSNKKHYWTQVFLVTTLVSCGLGFVSGFGVTAFEAQQTAATTHSAYTPLEFALQQCTRSTYGPICPLAQPGATVIALEPYYANRIAAPPINLNCKPFARTGGMAVQGKNLRMECVPGSHSRGSHSGYCTIDETPIALLPLTLFCGLAILLARKKFEKLVMK